MDDANPRSTEAARGGSAADLFRDPDLSWRQVSSGLATERRLIVVAVGVTGLVLIALGQLWVPDPADLVLSLVGAGLVAAAVVAWVVVGRVVRSWEYAERDEDLLVRRGRVFRRLTVIPYGRMQVIEVRANPVSGWLDIAAVTLVTASASTDAHIPGLPTAEAQALRDRLAARGEALTAGL